MRRKLAGRLAVWLGVGFLAGAEYSTTFSQEQTRDFRGRPAADQPAPRNDENSHLAHEQLLQKARQGRIDVYFIGDSITRRWGATDYPELLAHWKVTFFGWNAANFAWGGDSIQNMLWRLDHGEMEGVSPKVIVILAGTNNLGRHRDDEQAVRDISSGIEALVKKCVEKAPEAKIILTAIFPRNDNMAFIPVINRINETIARLADGDRIRFLNINDQLAGPEGKVFDGMMPDKLHPSLKGYQVWAESLKPILLEVLGPPAETDQAPPPTGDPSAERRGRRTAGNGPA